jgi:rhodanese-related sulfurtransferase
MADAPQGEAKEVSREEARKLIDEGAQLVDVRADHEWEAGRIAGAAHVPLPELPQRLEEIDKDRPVVVYCRGGNRSTMATDALAEAGYEALKLREGIVGWSEDDRPLEPEGGYVADSGEAAAILQAQKKPSHS